MPSSVFVFRYSELLLMENIFKKSRKLVSHKMCGFNEFDTIFFRMIRLLLLLLKEESSVFVYTYSELLLI